MMRFARSSRVYILVPIALLILMGNLALGQISVSLPNVSGAPNTTMTVPITVGSLTGQNIFSFDARIAFDSTKAKVTGIDRAGTISEGMSSVTTNTKPDTFIIAAAGISALSGSGTLIKLTVELRSPGISNLTFTFFRFNEGTPSSTTTNGSVSVVTSTVPVSLPTVTGNANATIKIPLTVGDLTGKGVQSFDLTVVFDSTVAKLTGIDRAGTLSEGMTSVLPNTAKPDTLIVAAAGTSNLTGSGTLINLVAELKGSGQTALTVTSFKFNEGNPGSQITNGSLTVNRKPTINSISPQTVNEGQALAFTVSATDADGDVLTYSSSNLPQGATLNSTTGAFAWTPGATQSGSYSVVFKASDPSGASDSTTVSITVVNVNSKPTITAISAKTVAEGAALTFTVAATDPDGDAVTYSSPNLPQGATLNATSGAFAWTPGFTQSGSYSISFKAADSGGLYDSVAVSITVTDVNRKPVISSRLPVTLPVVSQNVDQVFSVTASDPDGSALTYTWTVNNTQMQSGAQNSYTVKFSDAHGAAKTVACTVSDGTLDTSSTWSFTITDVEENDPIPTEFALGQNYPNPFNPTTIVDFALPKEAPVTIEIYNVLGVKVRSLLAGQNMSAGYHTVSWDGKSDAGATVPSGVYLYRMQADKFHSTKKMTLMK